MAQAKDTAMAMAQNRNRNQALNKEEKILLSLQQQEYDALRMVESFAQLIPDKAEREKNDLY